MCCTLHQQECCDGYVFMGNGAEGGNGGIWPIYAHAQRFTSLLLGDDAPCYMTWRPRTTTLQVAPSQPPILPYCTGMQQSKAHHARCMRQHDDNNKNKKGGAFESTKSS